MATCSIEKKKILIVPEEDGFFKRDETKVFDFQDKDRIVRFSDDDSLRTFTMLKGEMEGIQTGRMFLIAVVKGELKVDTSCPESGLCTIVAKTGDVVRCIGKNFISFESIEKTAVVVITRANDGSERVFDSNKSFENASLGNGVFSYKQGDCIKPISKETIEQAIRQMHGNNYINIRINIQGTTPFSFVEGGRSYSTRPGTIVIDVEPELPTTGQFGTMEMGTLQVVIPLVSKNPTKVKNPEPQPGVQRWLQGLVSATEAHVPYYKGKGAEITLNSLEPAEIIEWETHNEDQIIIVVSGILSVGVESEMSKKWQALNLNGGESFVIPAGWRHRLVNQREGPAKFLSIYVDVGRSEEETPKK